MLENQILTNKTITHFAFDSREVIPGSLFFALSGEKVDGHQFLKEVKSRGGVAAVVAKHYLGPDFGLKLYCVDNVMQFLHDLARAKQSKNTAKIIAITGSIGKTTTKDFISALLGEKYPHFKTPKSYNSQISLPISLLNAREDLDLYILEMAMSQKGQIKKLVSLAPPHIAIVTRISHSHMEFFSDPVAISEAKAEIFASHRLEKRIIGKQAMEFKPIVEASKAPAIIYGEESLLHTSDGCVQIQDREELSPPFPAPFKESHMLENFLCAALVCRELGLSWQEIIAGSHNLPRMPHRFEKIRKNGILYIDDSYNANADSTLAALKNLPKGKKRILIFADMKELGIMTKKAHEEVGKVAAELVDGCICMGEESKRIATIFQEKQKYAIHVSNKEAIKEAMSQILEPGDVVLIKGANSHRLWELVP